MQLFFPCNGASVPANVLPDGYKPISESFEVESGDTVTSNVTLSPKLCEALVIKSNEPVSVTVGDASFPVGPDALVWTRKANRGQPITTGDARVEITITNSSEKTTLVYVTACH